MQLILTIMTATTMTETNDAALNLAGVKQKIDLAQNDTSDRAEHKGGEVSLVCVSKTISVEQIIPALASGHRMFGENRVQEAATKWPHLRKQFTGIELHLIGPLQTNKVSLAVDTFDVIETVDREKLARALAREMEKANKQLPVFIQVNTGEEQQKAGVIPGAADDFITLCRDELKLDVSGLMCIPPIDAEPAMHFALLAKIAQRNNIKNLSMGMSADFETAIAFGSTHVRIGTAIFGARDKH